MAFFSSNQKLSEEFANPSIERVYQPQAPTSPFSGTRGITQDPLSTLAKAISGSGSGYTGSQFQTGASITNPTINPLVTIPGSGGGTTNPFADASTMPIWDGTAPGMPVSTVTGYAGGSSDVQTSSMTQEEMAAASYQSLQDYLNASTMERGIASGLLSMMGIPFGGSLMEIGMGINPLGDLTGEGNQTFSWYSGATDYFGNPISDAQANTVGGQVSSYGADEQGMFSGVANQYEADIVDMYGWGSKEHFDSIDQQFANLSAGKPLDYNPWNTWANLTNGFFGSGFGPGTPPATTVPTTVESVVSDDRGTITSVDIGEMEEAGFTQDDIDFITSGFDDTSSSSSDYSGDMGSISTDGQGGATYSSEATGDVSGTDYGGGSYGFDDGTGNEVGYESPGGDDGGGDSGGGGSYIATAATQALGEKGLKVFEDWRDYMFTVLPTFTASFGRYRATAPKIVSEIDKKENSKNIYSWIWDMHLKPIYDLIVEDKDSEKALKDYKVMVRELSNKFLVKEKV